MSTYVTGLTDAQEATLDELGLRGHAVVNITYGGLTALIFEEYEIKCWTIYQDGRYILETRDFTSDGWTNSEEDTEDE